MPTALENTTVMPFPRLFTTTLKHAQSCLPTVTALSRFESLLYDQHTHGVAKKKKKTLSCLKLQVVLNIHSELIYILSFDGLRARGKSLPL